MKCIEINNQKQLDSLPDKFDEYTIIQIKNTIERVSITKKWGNSSVVAWENSSVEAWGNSSVEARGNSSVVAWGNSSVEARGNSSVEARGNVGIHLYSDLATVILFMFSVCWQLAKGKIIKKSKTATVIKPKPITGLNSWLLNNAVKDKKIIILYKKVSKDFLTQENTKNETKWEINSIVEHKDWQPKKSECGEGKFHACSRVYFCDEFRSEKGDRYIAIEIKQQDLYAWPNPEYPYKIAFRTGKVLYEVNRLGKKI